MTTLNLTKSTFPVAVKRPAPRILVPFDLREAMPLKAFAAQAGVSIASARETVHIRWLGRKVGTRWAASRVAAAMYLDGDRAALTAYWAGDRTSDLVRHYFERIGIDPTTLGREG